MVTMFSLFGITFFLVVAEVFFNRSWLNQLRDGVERLCSKNYGALFAWPAVFAVAAYAVAAAIGLITGDLIAALADVGTACVMVFLCGIVGSFFSFLGDVGSLGRSAITGKPRSAKPGVRVSTSAFFITCVYGSIGMIYLKMAGYITEPVISVTVGG